MKKNNNTNHHDPQKTLDQYIICYDYQRRGNWEIIDRQQRQEAVKQFREGDMNDLI